MFTLTEVHIFAHWTFSFLFLPILLIALSFIQVEQKLQSCLHWLSSKFYSGHQKSWIIENGLLRLIYCPTDEMVADTLTKALPSPKVKHFAKELSLISIWGGVLEYSKANHNTSLVLTLWYRFISVKCHYYYFFCLQWPAVHSTPQPNLLSVSLSISAVFVAPFNPSYCVVQLNH